MSRQKQDPVKIVVTGSRGKSSVVRYIHTAFLVNGLTSYARITGVIPRSLTPSGTRVILRSSGAHVEEMRWWLKNIPGEPDAVIMENSSISPELQILPAKWFKPDIFVITNVRPDHQDAWGLDEEDAAKALISGIPCRSKVVLTRKLMKKPFVTEPLGSKNCILEEASMFDHGPNTEPFMKDNMSLVMKVCELTGLDMDKAEKAILSLQPDIADFRILDFGRSLLAVAFSANDLESTEILFQNTGWKRSETTLLFYNRRDRASRLRSFRKWIFSDQWKGTIIVGDRPLLLPKHAEYVDVNNVGSLKELIMENERVFGCGNVIGMPLDLLMLETL